MGQKIRPNSFRLGITQNWPVRWFPKKDFKQELEEDELIRRVIRETIGSAGIVRIEIERTAGPCRIFIKAARPGLVIGRGGKGVEALTRSIEAVLKKLFLERGETKKIALSINVEELRRSENAAQNIAQNIAWDLEKRLPYRRTIKKYLEAAVQDKKVEGAKIFLSGRLDGKEIARREWLAKGKLPLQTLRADIDYGMATAFTAYGTVGVKVWLYRGEIFNRNADS